VRLLLRLIFWPWLLAALVVGRLELLARLPFWGQLALAPALAAVLLAGAYAFRAPRAWLAALDLRRLVAVHAVRLYGVYLLFLYGRGALPYVFVPGAWSEIFVAVLAVAFVAVPLPGVVRRHAAVIWNTVGFVGLLLLALAAARVGAAQPWRLAAFARLPLCLLPVFVAPLLLAVHLIIYARLLPANPETTRPA